eukprot:418692-Pelagomonas_calceolata.AAC.2
MHMLPATCAGEAEHAAIGHNAVLNFVPEEHTQVMRQAMKHVLICAIRTHAGHAAGHEGCSGVSGNEGPKAPEGRQQLGMGSFPEPLPAEGRGQSVQAAD